MIACHKPSYSDLQFVKISVLVCRVEKINLIKLFLPEIFCSSIVPDKALFFNQKNTDFFSYFSQKHMFWYS